MIPYREIIREKFLGISQRKIAENLKISRNTVSRVLKKAKSLELIWPVIESMTDSELFNLLYPKNTCDTVEKNLDYDYYRHEMQKKGVTKKLLWIEYCNLCKTKEEEPLKYSQFCFYLSKYETKRRVTMHILRNPAESIEVDWAGDVVYITDSSTGKRRKVYLFVGVLPYSKYTYVEAFNNEKQESWITAHINMFEYFGGVAKTLVSDNCKTAIIQSNNYSELKINKTYQELSEHYGTVILPTRVRKPKDKASVEGAVGNITTFIIAAIRNKAFYSIEDLNIEIKQKLIEFNSNLFQKREGSRLSIFVKEEKPLLIALPATKFELSTWKIATVQINYHVQVEKNYYSCPFKYIKKKANVRITNQLVEIYVDDEKIASHTRIIGKIWQYSTKEEHMPNNHLHYAKWDKETFIKWAEKIGSSTAKVVNKFFTNVKVEQQAYRSCLALLSLEKKTSTEKLEYACSKVLEITSKPSVKSIKKIISSIKTENYNSEYKTEGLTRGSKYYSKSNGVNND